MATVNFSVPEEIKTRFNETFEGLNKSAIVAELMLEAIARAGRRQRSHEAASRLLQRRKTAPVVSATTLHKTREAGRG